MGRACVICPKFLLGDVALFAQQLGQQDSAAGGAAEGVVAQADELIVVLGVGPQTADGHGHAVFQIPVQTGLGTVGLLKIVEELLGSRGQFQLLGGTAEVGPVLADLLDGGLLTLGELHEHGGHVAVLTGHAEALRGDGGTLGLDDLVAVDMAPQLQRLLLTLLLLAADVGDAVVHHLGPTLEGLARAGDGLIGAYQRLLQTILPQGMQGGHIALERAVGLHGNEAPLGAQTLALRVDDGDVVGVDLGHYHGHIVGPAVGGVIGDHRALQLGVLLLQGADLVLLHVDGAEHKVHHRGQLLSVRLSVQHHQLLGLLGHGNIQCPAAGQSLLVGLAGTAAAGRDGGELEPGVILHQGDEPLAHHTRAADDTDLELFHDFFLLLLRISEAAFGD